MNMKSWMWMIVATASTVASTAEARPFRVDQLPRAPSDRGTCATCHMSVGGSPLNAFGLLVRSTLVPDQNGSVARSPVVWGPDLAIPDSDGDLFSNGEELGDPLGTWSEDQTRPSGPVYYPGDGNDAPECGNGDLDLANDEVCDGTSLGDQTCELVGFVGGGTLGCLSDCTDFDTSACFGVPQPDAGMTSMADAGATAGMTNGGRGIDYNDDNGCACVSPARSNLGPFAGLGLLMLGWWLFQRRRAATA